MIHRLTRTLWLPKPRNETFAFFADVTNLERFTPPSLHFRVVSPGPVVCGPGRIIDYRLSVFGLPIRWRTLITVWRPGDRFVDEQIEGPYRRWIHTHRFRDERGGTRMDDEVCYRLPLAPLGELGWPVIGWKLKGIFDFRAQAVARLIGGASVAPTPEPVG